jgi:hypothetical protein
VNSSHRYWHWALAAPRVTEGGALLPLGQLSLLAGDVLHVEGDAFETITRARLPWF